MYEAVRDVAFPFMKGMGAKGSAYTRHMENAIFKVPTPALLAKVVDMLDAIPMEDRDTKGGAREARAGGRWRFDRPLPAAPARGFRKGRCASSELTHMHEQRAYLTIPQWPASLGEDQRTDVLHQFLGVDEHRARELARRRTPAIYARFPFDRASRIAREMGDAGILAVAVPAAAIAKHAQPWLARTISVDLNERRVAVTRWPQGRDEFPARSIILLARAHCRDRVSPVGGGDFGVQSLHQLHGTYSAEDWNQGPAARGRLRVVETLDVHTIEGPHWRFIAGRFNIDPSGAAAERTPTSGAGIDHLAELLARLAGGRDVDRGCAEAQFLAEFAPDFGVQSDWRSLAGFGVYSAWLRHLAMLRQVA